MVFSDGKRCEEASHSESTPCKISERCRSVSRNLRWESQISSETRERDILDERIRRARQGEHDRITHFRGPHHFLTRPFALDLVPNFGVGRRGVNIDHANFSVPQFLAHALRKSFKSELAHAIRAPVGKSPFGCNGELSSNPATNSATRAGDEITLHSTRRKRRTPNAQRPTPNWFLSC